MIYIPEASRVALVLRLLNTNALDVKLYTAMSGALGDDTQVAGSFTEMSTMGYAAKAIAATTGWSAATPAANVPVAGAAAQQTWTFTGGTLVNVLGYYVTDHSSGALQWFEPFASAKPIQNNGDQIIITPTFTLYRA